MFSLFESCIKRLEHSPVRRGGKLVIPCLKIQNTIHPPSRLSLIIHIGQSGQFTYSSSHRAAAIRTDPAEFEISELMLFKTCRCVYANWGISHDRTDGGTAVFVFVKRCLSNTAQDINCRKTSRSLSTGERTPLTSAKIRLFPLSLPSRISLRDLCSKRSMKSLQI